MHNIDLKQDGGSVYPNRRFFCDDFQGKETCS